MLTCDVCGCSGPDIKPQRFFGIKGGKDRTFDACDPCSTMLFRERDEVVSKHLYSTPQGTRIVRYAMPEKLGWWRRNGLWVLLMVGGLTYASAGILGFVVQYYKLAGKL